MSSTPYILQSLTVANATKAIALKSGATIS